MTIPSVNDSVALFVNECVQVNLSLREGREGGDWFISVSLIVSSSVWCLLSSSALFNSADTQTSNSAFLNKVLRRSSPQISAI